MIFGVCVFFPLLLHMMDMWLNQWTQKKNYERLQKALDSVMSIREMTQVQEGGGRERREGWYNHVKATLVGSLLKFQLLLIISSSVVIPLLFMHNSSRNSCSCKTENNPKCCKWIKIHWKHHTCFFRARIWKSRNKWISSTPWPIPCYSGERRGSGWEWSMLTGFFFLHWFV